MPTKTQLLSEVDRLKLELSLYADRLTVEESERLRRDNARLVDEVRRCRGVIDHLLTAQQHLVESSKLLLRSGELAFPLDSVWR